MKTTTLLAALLAAAPLLAQSKTDWEEFELKGKVKHLETYTYQTTLRNDSVALKSMTFSFVADFNERGQILQFTKRYPRYSSHIYEMKATYDDQHRLIKQTYYKNSELTEWDTIAYNTKGLKETVWNYDETELVSKQTFSYTKKGALLQSTQTLPDGTEESKTINTYDKKNNIIEEAYYEKGKIAQRKKYQYKKTLSTITIETPEEISIHHITQQADTTTTRIETTPTNKPTTTQILQSFKTPEGRTEIVTNKDKDGNIITTNITTYDKNGQTLQRLQKDKDGSLVPYNSIQYQYQFDEHQNVIQCIEFLPNGNPLDATLKKLSYF